MDARCIDDPAALQAAGKMRAGKIRGERRRTQGLGGYIES